MLGFADLSVQPDAEGQALALMQSDSRRPLRLAEEPAAALTFFVIAPQRHFLYLRIHHLAIDCYGLLLIANHIAAHYAALIADRPAPQPPEPLSLAADEDAAYRNSARRAEDRNWWHDQLAGLPNAVSRAACGHEYLRARRELAPDLLAALLTFARTHRLVWPDILRALAGAYLARRSGGEAMIGLPYPARIGERMAAAPCTIANVLPHYLQLDENAPLPDWLAAQSARMAQGRHHGRYRSELLRRELGLTGRARLYGPVVKVQQFEKPPEFPGIDCRLHVLGTGAVEDRCRGADGAAAAAQSRGHEVAERAQKYLGCESRRQERDQPIEPPKHLLRSSTSRKEHRPRHQAPTQPHQTSAHRPRRMA